MTTYITADGHEIPTTIGLTIYIEDAPRWHGSTPERWTPHQRREFCDGLREIVAERDKTARVVYQGNHPTSVIVWLDGWFNDPTPEDPFRRFYADPDPFALRQYLEAHEYHVSHISFGYDPVMAG